MLKLPAGRVVCSLQTFQGAGLAVPSLFHEGRGSYLSKRGLFSDIIMRGQNVLGHCMGGGHAPPGNL